ncbi:hypothetical protein CMO91_05960 [Candidatus Woesearchaeota archaeon]|nr:hypothetical protein [Candidatus Woesearchaeota archaeon]
MDIYACRGLAKLKPSAKKAIDEGLEERTKLGLEVPENIDLVIQWCGTQNCDGSAFVSGEEQTVIINALPNVRDNFTNSLFSNYEDVTTFFSLVSDFIGRPGNDPQVLRFLREPKKCVDEYYALQKDPKVVEEFLTERGSTWEDYRNFVVNNAKPVRIMLTSLRKSLLEHWEQTDLNWLRHEIDHLDFMYNSELWKIKTRNGMRANKAETQFYEKKTKANSRQLAAAKTQALHSTLEVVTLLEIRAHFFDWVRGGDWTPEAIEKGATFAANSFTSSYATRGLMDDILQGIMPQHWSDGKMDAATSNMVHKVALMQAGQAIHRRYRVDLQDANVALSSKILCHEIPAWQATFVKYGEIASRACAKAFKEDRSRFAAANKAKTFDDYVATLSA